MPSYKSTFRYRQKARFPKYSRKSRTYKKKSSYSSKKSSAPLTRITSGATFVKGNDFMPQSLQTRFNYTQKVSFSAVTTPQSYAFRGNGGFDPDQTGTGAQPIGWDNMNTFYTYNEVYASRIHCTITNRNSTVLEYVLTPTTQAAESIAYETGGTLPKARRGHIGSSVNDSSDKSFSNYASTKDILGIESGSGADLRATFTAVPGQQWYWVLYVNSVDGATALSFTVTFTITYYCILTGRKTVALS